MKPALLIVDMQKYFYNEYPKIFKKQLIPNTAEVLAYFRKHNLPVIHIITVYKKDKSDWPNAFKSDNWIWCIEGKEEVEVVKELEPKDNEFVIVKKRYSSFYNPELQKTLTKLGVDTLVIAGFALDVCVRFTTMDAFNIGYDIYLLEDCTAPYFGQKQKAIEYIKELTQLKVITKKDLKKYFKAPF